METRIRILAAAYILSAAIAWIALTLMLMQSMISLIADPSSRDQIAAFTIGFITPIPFLVPVLVGAIGLLYRERWARPLMLYVSVIGILLFFLVVPLLVGAYGVVVLSGATAKQYFGEPLPPPPGAVVDERGPTIAT